MINQQRLLVNVFKVQLSKKLSPKSYDSYMKDAKNILLINCFNNIVDINIEVIMITIICLEMQS